MNIWKKAISAATSAALLASLLATAVAPAALASVTVTSAGNVPQGGSSAGTATFRITERAIASLPNSAGSIDIAILDSAGSNTLGFSGTPVVSAPGSLGASAAIVGNVLTFSWTHSDVLNIEYIDVSGLTIDDLGDAALGAIKATLQNATGSGVTVGDFQPGGTASGTIASGIGIGATSVTVNVTTPSCTFTSAGTLDFATSAESVGLTTAGAINTPGVGQQILTIGATASVHNAAEVVSEDTACLASGVLASPGTVVATLVYSNPTPKLTVYPGENNHLAQVLVLKEPSAGFLPKDSTFTYTIATAGVVFSTAPTVSLTNAYLSNEVQTVTLTSVTSGDTFTLTLGANTTSNLSGTATAATVQTALAGLGTIGSGNVTVTGVAGGPYTVTFVGTLAGTNVAQMTGAASAGSVAVGATTAGGTALTGAMVLSAPVLSSDRKSATVTVTTASTGAGATITLSNILYDVAATVPGGTFISVGVTTSGSKSVSPASRTNAVVFRGISASATSPTVYIGENSQATGLISFTESAAGFFTDGTGSNNTFWICPVGVTYAFTLAPYAKVVGGTAAGNLILRDGAAASTTNIVKGTQEGSCYKWTVWTKSTTASTIQIGNADLTSGPIINVTVAQAPGGVNVELYIGSSALDQQLASTVQFATATYRNQVTVTALSQPFIPAGSVNAAAGNVQISETGLGQLKNGERICFEVLPRSAAQLIQDTFFNSLNTADLPIATATGTGLVISPVNWSEQGCSGIGHAPAGYASSFSFTVLQQSTAGDGKVVISNMRYTTTADAVAGTVLFSVWGLGGAPTSVIFHSTVSNAKIGTAPPTGTTGIAFVTQTALGATKVGPFSNTTKVAALGKFQTWRFAGGSALAGKHISIYVATKNSSGIWSAFTKLTARLADSRGNAYFWWRYSTAKWISVRASYAGDATHSVSWSSPRQARWR